MTMDETVINNDVKEQMQYCVDNNLCGQRYYVLNSNTPSTEQLDLWCNTVNIDSFWEDAIDKCKEVDPSKFKEYIQGEWSPSVRDSNERATQRKQTPTADKKPRVAGACARIWELCDYAYNNVKYATFEDFKKDVRNTLKNEGINPSTISVQFSKWQKERLSQ